MKISRAVIGAIVVWACIGYLFADSQSKGKQSQNTSEIAVPDSYVLGSEDQIVIRCIDAEEISDKPVRIDSTGIINLPMIGAVQAGGRTAAQLEAEISQKLSVYIRNPKVAVSLVEVRSQPVSVLGCVNQPGVHQLTGKKSLIEVLSLAGGIRQDAGPVIMITRDMKWGTISLPDVRRDPSGNFQVAEVRVNSILQASTPEQNILIQPNDVITIPQGELIYVIGEVRKPGGFVLNSQENMSVLQAVSMAEGLTVRAGPKKAKILRPTAGAQRQEITVNLKDILSGRSQDIVLKPKDILFVPDNLPKSAALRGAEVALQIGTGLVIWRR